MLHKAKMIESFRNEFTTTRGDAERAVAFFFDAIRAELLAGGEVQIRDFGTFSSRVRKGGPRRNPRTGESVLVPDKTTTKFKPSKTLVDALNG